MLKNTITRGVNPYDMSAYQNPDLVRAVYDLSGAIKIGFIALGVALIVTLVILFWVIRDKKKKENDRIS